MALHQWMLAEGKTRKRRQIRLRTNAAGRWKQQRVRKLRVQLHKGTLLDRSDILKTKSFALVPKNSNNSTTIEGKMKISNDNGANYNNNNDNHNNDNSKNSVVSNADYFNAIIHAIAPGPLDIPALYRTHDISPSTDFTKYVTSPSPSSLSSSSSSSSSLSSVNSDKDEGTIVSSTTISYSSIFINTNTTTTITTIVTTTANTVRAGKNTKIHPSINVKHAVTNCTPYSGMYWSTTASSATAMIECKTNNGKLIYSSLSIYSLQLINFYK
ncbi:unnamed protein product [Litomosoides sigmodontis]|uniref:Uncharacterized protein n=1 Tax=Litomosoides sigmodontis TaxID=42156 RepID=A0A3P6TAH5_LITSI|nr:unnamed protein product [Litomosoides sigmodontis]